MPRAESGPNLTAPALYINRELSLLQYFQRVLAQTTDERHPLLERVNYLWIVSSLIDEFFMVRVSDLQDDIDAGIMVLGPDGMTPAQQVTAIRRRAVALYAEMHRVWSEHLLPELATQGIRIVDLQELTTNQRAALRTYFEQDIFPVLTPLAVDPGHPFPHISNLSVNLAVDLASDGSETRFARVKIPDVIPRLLHVEKILGQTANGKRAKYTFVWLDQLVAANLASLFPGIPVLSSYSFRVIRDADIEIHQEEGADLRMTMERGLRQRRFGEPVMMKVERAMPERLRSLLAERLKLRPEDIYPTDRPMGMVNLRQLVAIDRPDLKYPTFVPRVPAPLAGGEPVMSAVDHSDILVYLPYDSFAPIVDLLNAAARDENVLAIKQTLYRVGTDSPVVRALLEAANQGKQVAVLVELKARFDEESNIEWARELERAGAHVAYGFVGLKTHAKVLMIVRKDRDGGIRRYVHVGTGNYNVSTARGYTDLGLFTADRDFAADATDLFNYLTGYSQQTAYRRFLVAPLNLRQGLLERIEREIKLHKKDGKGHLIFKMNSLTEPEFIQALYRASQAGVKVDLIVRGICSLRPGVEDVSENIKVISIVGRFLEHSRVYYFRNGGEPEVYCGSADLMERNLSHRVEVLFPVLDSSIRERIVRDILHAQLRDTVNSWKELSDGTYEHIRPSGEPFDSQAWNLEHGA